MDSIAADLEEGALEDCDRDALAGLEHLLERHAEFDAYCAEAGLEAGA